MILAHGELKELNSMEGILSTIKKLLGVSNEDVSFDVDILVYINTTLSTLSQLGLVEADKHPIISPSDIWYDLLGSRTDLEMVKTYIHLSTKMMFDPPPNSAAIEAINRKIAELEWRIANLETNKGVIVSEPIITE